MQTNQISSKDLRMAPLMSQVAALTGQKHISCSEDDVLDIVAKYPGTAGLASSLKKTLKSLRSMTVFEEIADIGKALSMLTGTDDVRARNADIFAARYGAADLDDKGTLEILAARHDLTRERVRQIVDKMVSKLGNKTLWTPACDEAIESGTYTRMSENDFHAFSAFARDVLGITLQMERIRVRGRVIVNTPVMTEFTVKVNTASQRLIARNGAAQTYVAYALASSMSPDRHPLPFADFLDILSKTPDIIWLDESSGWYAFEDDLKSAKRNRIRNHLLKMLACAQKSVDVEEAFGQLGRYRERGREDAGDTPFISIQPAVLKALMRHIPEAKHTGFDDFIMHGDREAARNTVLSNVEKKIYDLMVRHGGVISRAQVRKELVATKQISDPSFTVTWERSPILAAVERGICRIVGWDIDAEALKAARFTVNSYSR